ncbi:MAG: DinB family protein [Vicinamibacterales bacterium]
MTHAERQILIQRYADGYEAVADALAGATDAELDARPAPGRWSAREIVHHLADSEMTSAIRLRRLLVETDPLVQGYDQDAFASRLFYDRPIGASLDAFRAARASTVEILRRLNDADWTRSGRHSESGPYSMLDWLRIYSAHAHDHAAQIRRARASG